VNSGHSYPEQRDGDFMPKFVVGVGIDEELMQRLRNAVWHLGKGMTITSVLSAAIEKAR
jgi:hypothetical protein